LETNGVIHFPDPYLQGFGWDEVGELVYPFKPRSQQAAAEGAAAAAAAAAASADRSRSQDLVRRHAAGHAVRP
jgi:hypothetical protein